MDNEQDKKTHLLPDFELEEQARQMEQALPQLGAPTLEGKREILLQIGDTVQRIPIADDMRCMLGRFDGKETRGQTVDLTPYGALEHGISRFHARLQVADQRLYLTDLESTNGSYVRGERLKPNRPVELQDGDFILLGSLPIQVSFR